jgi:hypothetical protein
VSNRPWRHRRQPRSSRTTARPPGRGYGQRGVSIWRDSDRGSTTIEMAIFVVAMCFPIAVGIAAACGAWITGDNPFTAGLYYLLFSVGLLVALGAGIAGSVTLQDALRSRRCRRVRAREGRLLASWLGVNDPHELTEEELLVWHRASRGPRRVLNAREAQRWADAGIGYPTAAIAARRHIELPRVQALVQTVTPILREGGVWGQEDDARSPQRQVHDLIGAHWKGRQQVLHRWMAMDVDLVALVLKRCVGPGVRFEPAYVLQHMEDRARELRAAGSPK